jgi:DNA-binding NtrC family response regulator
MPTVRLNEDAQKMIQNYRWNGNIRQLKNIAEQLSVLERERAITGSIISSYLPDPKNNLPALISENKKEGDFNSEREILYKILFDMKRDLNELKKITNNLKSKSVDQSNTFNDIENLIPQEFDQSKNDIQPKSDFSETNQSKIKEDKYQFAEEIIEEETLSIQDKELELIIKALERNNGRRKAAAKELGISERTLYRKIKQYDLEL